MQFNSITRVKEHLRGEGFESEDDTNTAVTATLHRLSKHEHKAAIDRLPHGWENVRTVLVRTLRTYVQHSGISVLLLSFIFITTKAYPKLLQ
jgi:hypothetical protein